MTARSVVASLAGAALLSVATVGRSLTAQSAPAPIQVMVLGTFHFHNPNADYGKFQGIDVLTPARQAQIEAVVAALARYAPTKIAIERVPDEADSIDAQYHRYQAGTFTLTRNEVHQLGFRLADRLHQDRLYPIDYSEGMPIDSVMAYAQQHDTGFVARFNRVVTEAVQTMDRMQRDESIAANLRFMNEPAILLRAQQPYLDMATVGAEDTYIGARAVSAWYDRNLHMFANIAHIAVPGDRILVIVGMGHAPMLGGFVRESAAMALVDPLPYLP